MTIQRAIEIAIDGGYRPDPNMDKFHRAVSIYNWLDSQLLVSTLEPSFWRSLGSVLEWKSEAGSYHDDIAWEEYWHRFVDHLAEGKDAESFFEQF